MYACILIFLLNPHSGSSSSPWSFMVSTVVADHSDPEFIMAVVEYETKVAVALVRNNNGSEFEDSCAVRDDLRKTYEKCKDISQESRALICTLLKESCEKDRELHLSMYGKATQLQKQMDAKSAWFQEKYSGRTHGGTSQTDFPLTEKELHQLRMDEEALKEMLEEEAMNKKAQKEKIRQERAKNNAFYLEFGVVRYDSDCESSD
ncbi:hypothetical protein Tco_0511616 [Tanacetum coccineum]